MLELIRTSTLLASTKIIVNVDNSLKYTLVIVPMAQKGPSPFLATVLKTRRSNSFSSTIAHRFDLPTMSPGACNDTSMSKRGRSIQSVVSMSAPEITPDCINFAMDAQGSVQGIWLQMPVRVRRIRAQENLHQFSNMRHPNVELLLGVVRKGQVQWAVTDVTATRSLSSAKCTTDDVIRAALDVARAVVYIHATTGVPHGEVYAENVILDDVKFRTVLCKGRARKSDTYVGKKLGFDFDVKCIAILVLRLCARAAGVKPISKAHDGRTTIREEAMQCVPDPVRSLIRKCLRADRKNVPSMSEMCIALQTCVQKT